MHRKQTFLSLCLLILSLNVWAQRENTDCLDRGLVAVKTTSGVFCSWRIQADEYYDVCYNLYRDGVKVNEAPLSVSNYLDAAGDSDCKYAVRKVFRGVEESDAKTVGVWQSNYLDITPKHDPSLTSTYVPNDACCADVDGDGEVEILMKYDNQSEINASYPKEGYNGEYSLFECLKLDGTVLWWVNCGPNMGDFQNNEQNIVAYDWDGDGRAEALFRAADGTTIHMANGSTFVVGDADLNYRADTGGGTNWFMHSGAEFLLYVDGQTGQPYQCIDYPLPRLEESENPNHLLSGSTYDDLVKSAWGDGYGHRSSKHFFGAPYLDGHKPSIFIGRGIYTQHKFVAFDVNPDSHELIERWRWYNKNAGPWYAQGYHNYSIADVDWDGRDEIVWGSMVIDDNGLGLSTTGLGHGDAHHVGDLNPYLHGQEGFFCNEDQPANNYRDLTTSKIYYRMVDTNDAGRSMAGNFSDDFPGSIGWGAHDSPISTVTNGHVEGLDSYGLSQNFRIYWDGDLLEECADGTSISKYGKGQITRLEGALSNNSTKNTPCMQGDILGDWREEVIMRTSNNHIRIYTTTIPTSWRNYSLWYDPQYRNAMVWQMCGYNQPPHVSYFLGETEGITMAPPPSTTQGRMRVKDGETIGGDMKDLHVLVSENHDATVTVSNGAEPWIVTFDVPSWVQGTAESNCTQKETPIDKVEYVLNVVGGSFGGSNHVVKQGDGILKLPDVEETYSGSTDVWAGTLEFDGALPNSHLWLNRFAKLQSNGGRFSTIRADYASEIHVGDEHVAGKIAVDSLFLGFGARVFFDITTSGCDMVDANVLSVETKNWENGPAYLSPVFEFNVDGKTTAPAYYTLMHVREIQGNIEDIIVEGLQGVNAELVVDGEYICLHLSKSRDPEDIVWTGIESSVWDNDNTPNFTSSNQTFVTGDTVTFDDSAVRTEVELTKQVNPGSVVFKNNEKNYRIFGQGSMSGTMNLVKQGAGTVVIENTNTYTGGTQVYEGVLEPKMLANKDGQEFGSLGSIDAEILIENGGTLRTTADLTNSQTILVGEQGGVLDVSGTLIQNGSIKRNTNVSRTSLYKTGKGTLQLDSSFQCDTLYIDEGSVYDFGDYHFDGKTIIFRNGTLRYNNSIYSYNSDNATYMVPEGYTGSVYPDGRCDYIGKLLGRGTFNVNATFVRMYFKGDWSQFEGTINAYQYKSSQYDPSFDFLNAYGIGNATLNITDGVTVHTNGKDFAIGALTGSGSIDNSGTSATANNTLTLGGKNIDYTYNGSIVGSRVNKVGSGTWTITNSEVLKNADQLNINGGAVKINSITEFVSLTGSKMVRVNDGGAIWGRGPVQSITIFRGGEYRPGVASSVTGNAGTIHALEDFIANEGSHLYLNKSSKNDYNSKTGQPLFSYVEADGEIIVNGNVHFTYKTGSSGWTPVAGDSVILFMSPSISGDPKLDLQELPTDLAWDTSTLMVDGAIRVVAASGIHAAPVDSCPKNVSVYDIAGNLVATFVIETSEDVLVKMRQCGLNRSIYLAKIDCSGNTIVKRMILK